MFNLLLPLIMIAVLFMLFRSNKKRQEQATQMRSAMEPGSGVRTIGGMYALVKSVNEETVELEIAPGVVTHYTKSAIAAVLDPQEYDAIINGRPDEPELSELDAVEDEPAVEQPLSLDKAGSDKKDVSDNGGTDGEAPASK
ncbi:preprotein translocase subunit YajC [Kitasatospora atroaurantiaca]|uniref:Preprotein translocase subunit YajC n=1 Tax=Kitasatospora atroaurantiaca TaxID=285545 RepID=A0A561EZE1_9ACTN|nr:preprotein translocase subunit YajC [Kitasatospora atroaurantiaca]TWE20973.1 preprotein translocase subunit YajC [Kitasatospora atroaurantiaca]